jgi:hypothetical protein
MPPEDRQRLPEASPCGSPAPRGHLLEGSEAYSRTDYFWCAQVVCLG